MHRRALFFSMATLLAMTSCAHKPAVVEEPKLRAADYQPLAIGNQWTYAGKVGGQPVEKTITITEKRDGFFADDAGGMLRMDAEGLRDEMRYLLRDPLESGNKWKSIVSVSSTEQYEIVDVGFTTAVKAGVFNDCVLVRGSNRIDAERALRTDWTYAPQVGIVRIVSTAVFGGREIPQAELELTSFKLASP